MVCRNILFGLATMLIQIGTTSAQTKSTGISPALLSEFQKTTEKWKDAYNSGDANNLIPFYTENASYVSGHVDGLQLDGRDKVISNFQKGASGGGHVDKIEIISACRSRELVTLLTKYQATNSGQTVIGRNILVLVKVKGEWLIVLHASVI